MSEKIPLLLLQLNTPAYVRHPENQPYEVLPLLYDRRSFPGGEVFLRLEEPGLVDGRPVLITARLRNSDDIMTLLMATDALRRAMCGPLTLKLYYVPYGRQDRVASPGESLSLAVMANLINGLNFERVILLEPHSDVTAFAIHRSTIVTSGSEGFSGSVRTKLSQYHGGPGLQNCVLVSPDAGASKRAERMSQELQVTDLAQGGKHRDPKTNAISGFSCDRMDFEGKVAIIVDDLCDAGGTFIGLGKLLRERNVGGVRLMVTHGLFTKGLAPLAGVIDQVYTTNSFQDADHFAPVDGVWLYVHPLHLF